MRVPFLDLRVGYVQLRDELDRAYRRVMESGRYILGNEVEAFEEEWARYCGTRHCVAVGSGLDALHLALRAMGVGSGDEVVVPSNTYIATWLAVSHAGATPVPVEPDPVTYNIDPENVKDALTTRTRVILPVHLYGQTAEMSSLQEIAARHGLPLLEDAAQAHGALHGGRRTGGLGDAGAWSFYPTKNLGAFGDGGAVTTDDPAIAERIRLLRNYGSRTRYENELQGFNSRLDPLQAAFLRAGLPRLEENNRRRQGVALRYLDLLSGHPTLTLPRIHPQGQSAWHQFVVRHPQRDGLKEHLEKQGIETLIHYPIPPHRSSAYFASFGARNFPIADDLASTLLSLPVGPHLEPDQVEYVASALAAYSPPG